MFKLLYGMFLFLGPIHFLILATRLEPNPPFVLQVVATLSTAIATYLGGVTIVEQVKKW